MNIKYKTLIIAVISTILIISLTYLIFHIAYFGYINDTEEYQINKSFEIINQMLNKEKDNLEVTVTDWAHWDDTFYFIKDSNLEYIASNLQYNSLETLNLKLIIFLDDKGHIIYSEHSELDKELIDSINRKLFSNKESLSKVISSSDIHDVKSGILLAETKAFLVSVAPITTSDELSASNGSLIMIRSVDNELLDYIQNVTGVTLEFSEYTTQNFKSHEKTNTLSSSIRNHQYKSLLKASQSICDITGDSNIILSVTKENSNYKDVFYYFKFFLIGFVLTILFISFIILAVIYKYILNRLLMLYNFMNTVATTKDTSLSISMPGTDEFCTLANAANKMLSQLNSAYKDIREMSERFRIIMEATSDGYVEFDISKEELYISPEWKSMIGYTSEDGHSLYGEYMSKVHPDYYEYIKQAYAGILNQKSDYFQYEYPLVRESGETTWVLERGKITQKDASGYPLRLVSTLTNITARKVHEEEILFLSYSDKLTGLKNRAYMEEQFDELDKDKNSRYFIIMGDLNGLKLTNDAFGHKEGDKLLSIVSTILKENCASDDIISRWGGDEFIILVKHKDKNYVSQLISKIRDACSLVTEFHFKVSISLGYAEKSESSIDANAVMSLAENRMYRNKLIEDTSARNATISSLSRTLHEKHSETEEHTMRIRNLSLNLGKRLKLSQDKLDELELLALLHDIGKIGIPDHILMKPGKLTAEEWHIMKTHSEIGYRIAKSTPELSHISDEILSHHERFDGTGYPNGLIGKHIPLLSRIINIVDSFDVMTHRRVYKDAADLNYALAELRRCSGTQFDPFIVEEFLGLLEEQGMSSDLLEDII
ncbi:MAG: domain S-box/diguanylate cyclase protein [Clostridia bacterium]|jgi:diguanylate cyclase (GGDEF)-like protein/PAS domain S-box-containing protein|nr:domain S-box/diguanylate cyclase protein [Clostridia bacterium]